MAVQLKNAWRSAYWALWRDEIYLSVMLIEVLRSTQYARGERRYKEKKRGDDIRSREIAINKSATSRDHIILLRDDEVEPIRLA
jgi:hypothetical protein